MEVDLDAFALVDDVVDAEALADSGTRAFTLEGESAQLGEARCLAQGESREVGHDRLALGRGRGRLHALFLVVAAPLLRLARRLGKGVARQLDMSIA